MNRRRFNYLLSLMGASPLPIMLNQLSVKISEPPSLESSIDNSNVLVLIQLKGGNDGLNTFVPINQYDKYASLRPTIRINEKKLIHLDKTLSLQQQLGLHPNLDSLKYHYENGRMSIVQSVSYPNTNLSHFKSSDLWMTGGDGNPDAKQPKKGWIGKFMECAYPDKLVSSKDFQDPLAIQLGNPNTSLLFQIDEHHECNVNLSGQNPGGYYNSIVNVGGKAPEKFDDTFFGSQMRYISGVQNTTNVYAKRISEVFDKGKNTLDYPDTNLSNQLKTVARLLSGGSQTKVFLVQLPKFDTHRNQILAGNSLEGVHAELLKELSDSVNVFLKDIKKLGIGDKVLAMTFSEFGRKAKENGDFGTDHGSMAPLMLFGNKVNGGVFGENELLNQLDENGLLTKMQYDYRQIYSSVLKNWLGANNEILDQLNLTTHLKNAPKVL